MKRKISLILCCIFIVFSLAACTSTYQEAMAKSESGETEPEGFGGGYFTVIAEWSNTEYSYKIVYANDTKVKYLIMTTGHRCGITALYNADGSVQVYNEEQ